MAKLIDNNNFIETQMAWVEKQISNGTMENWKTGIGFAKILNEYELIKLVNIKCTSELSPIRSMLSNTGLNKLSNTIASAKKRRGSSKKSLQLTLEIEQIDKLAEIAEKHGVTISQLIKIKFDI